MKITARCHPALKDLLPPPIPAEKLLPDWLKSMPDRVRSDTIGGAEVRTLKQCAPLIDAMRLGVLIPIPVDLDVKDGEVHWDWDPPPLPDTLITRAPIGAHVPEQATGSPYAADHLIVKFINYWTLETQPGWSLLVLHPIGYPDLPFQTLSGVVDTDRFCDGYVHFPARLPPDFEGRIAKGTPVAQIVPIPKGATLETEVMTEANISANRDVQDALAAEPGVYRKRFRK